MMAATPVGTPDGMVIANDLDEKRCYMLYHQIKRLLRYMAFALLCWRVRVYHLRCSQSHMLAAPVPMAL
jgi:hypothetical protein